MSILNEDLIHDDGMIYELSQKIILNKNDQYGRNDLFHIPFRRIFQCTYEDVASLDENIQQQIPWSFQSVEILPTDKYPISFYRLVVGDSSYGEFK